MGLFVVRSSDLNCNNDTTMYKMFYKKRILEYVDKGMIDENYHAVSTMNEIFCLYRKPEIDALMKGILFHVFILLGWICFRIFMIINLTG